MKKLSSFFLVVILALLSAGLAFFFLFSGGVLKYENPSKSTPSLSREVDLSWGSNLSETHEENTKSLPFSGTSFQDLVDLGLTQENASQYLLANLPLCSHPELQELEPLEINKLVKNCSTKEKKGTIPDGLGWACFGYATYDDLGKRLLLMNECIDGLDPQTWYQNDGKSPTFLCKETHDPDYVIVWELWNEKEQKNSYTYESKFPSFALEKALASWLLSVAIPMVYNTASLYCLENDPDCQNTYDVGAWSDEEWNYFLAGTRGTPYEKTLYAINDRVYDPGETHGERPSGLSTPDQSRESPWLFGGIKDNTIIVKKLKNYRAVGVYNPETNSIYSTFTLETCEIDL